MRQSPKSVIVLTTDGEASLQVKRKQVPRIMSKKYVIIGASAAGIAAAHKIHVLDPTGTITLISEEKEAPYNKCLLSSYFISNVSPSLSIKNTINFLSSTRATEVIPKDKLVLLNNTEYIEYDKLLFATGSRPNTEQAGNNYFFWHSLSDIMRITNFIKANNVRQALIIGAGINGIECADALATKGIQVTIIEKQEHILNNLCALETASAIKQHIEKTGVTIYTQTIIREYDSNQDGTRVVLSNYKELFCDMVIFAGGTVPQIELAQRAMISCKQNAIVTNNYLESSEPSIFAAGDCALVYNRLTEQFQPSFLWPDAIIQGNIAGANMTGQQLVYNGIVSLIQSSFFGLSFASCGPVSSQELKKQGTLQETLFFDSKERLCAFTLLGNTAHASVLRQKILSDKIYF